MSPSAQPPLGARRGVVVDFCCVGCRAAAGSSIVTPVVSSMSALVIQGSEGGSGFVELPFGAIRAARYVLRKPRCSWDAKCGNGFYSSTASQRAVISPGASEEGREKVIPCSDSHSTSQRMRNTPRRVKSPAHNLAGAIRISRATHAPSDQLELVSSSFPSTTRPSWPPATKTRSK